MNNTEGAQGEKRKGTPNKRWTKEMDNVLIPLLADMARSGLKVDKSFKRQAFVEAANVVNKKKLVLEDETYRTYVEGQPKAKEYLNKPIPFFDELRLVAGDDHATGDYARTIFDQFGSTPGEDESAPPLNTPLDGEPMETENERHEALRASTNKTTARATRRTRTNGENGLGENIGEKIGELAASIDRNRKRTWKEKLADVLWNMEGYSDDDMEMVYNKLIDNKKEAENFYLRKPSL
ncbi:uncharacterized protein LOC120282566 [Dioscorea cayenensis subsp. rotundata]|uniref:Uncharacterized protein LOC120282566 n=1 Tax=Dioscorea cayennensis subsp. rotundata TaxID=55577 RepID=A0AB40D3I5_DIOCR|nr:uncharacterized protein LOC120282566 [Dioscorea cayenensis subsp. rotundata]